MSSFDRPSILALLLPLSLMLSLVSCPSTDVGDPLDRDLQEAIVSTLMADSSLWPHVGLEIAGARCVSVADGAVTLRILGGQAKLNNGVRTEISLDYPFEEGQTVLYSWEMMIPEGFIHDAPDNRWWVMGQWHDQPDPALGETWEGFPAHSPPQAFYFGYLDGAYRLQPQYGGSRDDDPSRLITLVPGQWLRLRVEISWSQGQEGSMSIWLDEDAEPYAAWTGPNMLNGYQHYLKLGMYRHPDIMSDNEIKLRRLAVETR